MASGKTSKAMRSARSTVVARRSPPWGTIAAVLVVLLFAGAVFGYFLIKKSDQNALQAFSPSASNQDPSTTISGVVVKTYAGGSHVTRAQRVAYTQSPPSGGAHDQYWAACNGVVYPSAVRSENMVHSLEHGTVWIAYNPDKVSGSALDSLSARVTGKPYTMMSPYPGLDAPISLQSWGHQLKLDDANDPRIDQFIQALRRNQYTHPEVGASCEALGGDQFDQDNPPAFDPAPPGPVGPNVVAEDAPPAANNGEQLGQTPAPAQAPASP